jgi:putative hydrolase of the HAD superfamily
MRAVIFDWGGTLTPFRSVNPAEGWRIYAEAFSEPAQAAAVAAQLLAAEDAAWKQVHRDGTAFTFDSLLAASGVPEHPEAVRSFRAFWDQITHTREEVLPTLTALRERGLRTGVLSSTWWPGEWHEEALHRDGVFDAFDACVWSSRLPFTKPHPTAFLRAMEAIGIDDPADCVYVGDRLFDDISGAKGVGMRAVFVPHSKIPPNQTEPVDVTPDAVIQRLTDLIPLVDSWS